MKSKKTDIKYLTWVCRNILSVLEEEEKKDRVKMTHSSPENGATRSKTETF